MRLTSNVYLVGSGSFGFDLTDPYDCHIYLIDGGGELALIDLGAGMQAESVLDNVRKDGFEPGRIRHLILTHPHGDHAGGAARFRRLLGGPAVYASEKIAAWIARGDEAAISLDIAKARGFYPADYTLEPCPVDVPVREGDSIRVGKERLQVLDTPGHSAGHICLLLEQAGERLLFTGDLVFFGGAVMLQSAQDCQVGELVRSLRKMRDLRVNALLPGHLSISLKQGQRHIELANRALDELRLPNQAIQSW